MIEREVVGAALLAAGRPVTLSELAEVLGVPSEAARRVLDEYASMLREAALGFEVEEVAGGYRLIVPPALTSHLRPLLAPPPLPGLSGAALEVLAIVAYKQPVTRAEIEAMRGAPAGALVTLQERELVKVVGRGDAVGRPLLYGTTQKFLLEFGLRGLEDLPPLTDGEFAGLLRG
ncbi:SMC-Scp complex subunit ScpB [Deinococcus yavapaiensis]|uniref:Condensin subunit ScpB n=1 Tax=Deinococcus yavapaiensis KR-236 TaxID=694435 RepID=A0A318S5L3_9DEIO|nr:SMC-Scp complex subunit ScpB [Deinococcus yavapaiensis]PYE49452.1 condensin subunit ScpB [Deinococcus yavapaiensis KR-236]